MARKDALDKAAAAKTKQTQCAQDKKCEAEAKRQKEIYRAWSVQNDHLKIAVMEMNRTLAERHLEFKLVREPDLKRVGAQIDLRLFENGEQKLCASITLSDDAVKIDTKATDLRNEDIEHVLCRRNLVQLLRNHGGPAGAAVPLVRRPAAGFTSR